MNITPQEAEQQRALALDSVIIDVRTPAEFEEVHAAGAVNIPLHTLTAETLAPYRSLAEEGKVMMICKSGGRSQQACEKAAAFGLGGFKNIEGGTSEWEAAGLPVKRGGSAAISLERQVRIVAGALVFSGALLSLFASRWFALLPLFVGGGLVFAGVTDTCAMGMLLARMPWNQGLS